jgi:hypothetical protein
MQKDIGRLFRLDAPPGMATYAHALASHPRRPEPQKMSDVPGLNLSVRSSVQSQGSVMECTLIAIGDNGTGGFPENARPERGWSLQLAKGPGTERRCHSAAGLDRGS